NFSGKASPFQLSFRRKQSAACETQTASHPEQFPQPHPRELFALDCMTKIPPLLPQETLLRVLRVARFDGTGALILGGTFALMMASEHDFPFAAIGLLAAGAGAIELHGAALLKQGESRGMSWLVASQPYLLLVILAYCALRLWFVQIPP